MTTPDAPHGAGLTVRAGAATDVGRVRQHNEDSVLADRTVFVVADGMGGHAAGEVASRIVTATLGELADAPVRRREDLVAALALANRRILESVAQHPEQTGMGTTAAGLAVVRAGGSDHWAVFNVGDSRVYRFVDGQLRLVTVDHSEVRELIDAGLITEEESARHPLRNVVTRSMGSESLPTPDIWVFPPHAGERFVICSDGLSNELSSDRIRQIVAEHDDPQDCAEALVSAGVAAGGRDNVSVVVVALDSDDADLDDIDTAPRASAGAAGGEG
ncbi:protein phosphatase [Pedococcus dokdonensis]|uniref:Protein phosphatase n=1 Tax=Pedococcus dokdonensis TaxID=443156 RepID=A0A1H0TH28_9MICO|nr:protein phosphatase 2C domain-containing protein [Pedococcus dokdonensis]SDP53299.1 protein phosphatase [Pedococcus dokdonensis]